MRDVSKREKRNKDTKIEKRQKPTIHKRTDDRQVEQKIKQIKVKKNDAQNDQSKQKRQTRQTNENDQTIITTIREN